MFRPGDGGVRRKGRDRKRNGERQRRKRKKRAERKRENTATEKEGRGQWNEEEEVWAAQLRACCVPDCSAVQSDTNWAQTDS